MQMDPVLLLNAIRTKHINFSYSQRLKLNIVVQRFLCDIALTSIMTGLLFDTSY
jgi:hypothetical protein